MTELSSPAFVTVTDEPAPPQSITSSLCLQISDLEAKREELSGTAGTNLRK